MSTISNEPVTQTNQSLEDKIPTSLPHRDPIAPPEIELIKQTRSVCPTCMGIIDADVGIENDQVWMYKSCPTHGFFKGFVEQNIDFYRATMNLPPVDPLEYRTLVIPVTHRCNLDCTLCFVPKRDRDDLSFEAIKRIINSFKGRFICLSGGEPTLRDDLVEIIEYATYQGKIVQLFSNAIKLADKDYVSKLVDAGMKYILFSFNGFDDVYFERINGRPLLDIKLKALENCIDQKVFISLSPTIFRDLNEESLQPLMKLCIDNAKYIIELRIRGAAQVGRHQKFSPLSTYELFSLVADALGRPVPAILADFKPEICYHSIIQFNMLAAFESTSAGYTFYDWTSGAWKKGSDYSSLMYDFHQTMLRRRGIRLDYDDLIHSDRFRLLEINTWGWPDASNIDFYEIQSHGVYHLYNNAIPMNFCEAMLRAEQL